VGLRNGQITLCIKNAIYNIDTCKVVLHMGLLLQLLFIFALLNPTSGHSWVACGDYSVADPKAAPKGLAETDAARITYDPTKCSGYARGWSKFAAPFGTDLGANFQGTDINLCQTPKNDPNAYTTTYPAPVYRAGETACMAYPAKNHKADTCTNMFIPDTELSIYISAVNPTVDPILSQMTKLHHYNGVHQDGTIDNKGFQNCPNFCGAGMDKATCTVCFDLPSTLVPGKYVIIWYWVFNKGTPAYTSCMDPTIIASGGTSPVPAPTVPAPKPVVTPTPPAPTAPKPIVPAPTPPAALSCYCNCPCNTQCWKKCTCATPGATHTCPICSGTAPSPSPPVVAPIVPAPVQTSCISTWGQCSGLGYAGATTCCSASDICVGLNTYYGQCRPR